MATLPRILFLFPHPDDESFLTGGTIAAYAHSRRAEVILYTLTQGEASRNAAHLGISPEEIGKRRMLEVKLAANILGVKEFVQGEYPDGSLRDIDLRILEEDVTEKILRFRPHVLVTFDVQGGSVHPDHITLHHIVKRVFLTMKEEYPFLQRLCFTGLPAHRTHHWPRKIFGIPEHRLSAVIDVSAYHHIEREAVFTHVSVRRDVEEHNYDEWMFWDQEYYEFYHERFTPPVNDLLYGIDGSL